MHYILDFCLLQGHLPPLVLNENINKFFISSSPTSWITHYVDYTRKYGLGYLMCDGSIGIYFNDATKVPLFLLLDNSRKWRKLV